eukprot:54120-Eustigmatos_ZCMA.PRE.1
MRLVESLTTKAQDLYGEAGAIAEEGFSSIRTVAAFGGEKKIVKRYAAKLVEVEKVSIESSLAVARGIGEWGQCVCSTSDGLSHVHALTCTRTQPPVSTPSDMQTQTQTQTQNPLRHRTVLRFIQHTYLPSSHPSYLPTYIHTHTYTYTCIRTYIHS